MAVYQDRYPDDADGYNPLVELLLQGITGTGASIAGGLVGLAGLPYGIDAAANAVRRTQDALTYQPKSSGAIEAAEMLAGIFEPVEQAKQWLGDQTMEATDSPLAATAAYAAPEIIESLLGLKAVKALGGQQYEIGDIGGQATGMGRREMGAVGGGDERIKIANTRFGHVGKGERLEADGGFIDVVEPQFSPVKKSIIEFFVDESSRGQGIGRLLLDEAIKRYGAGLGGAISNEFLVDSLYKRGFRGVGGNRNKSLNELKNIQRDQSSVTMMLP